MMMKEYTFRHKIAPFFSGLMTYRPLVEVAVEGLRKGVGGEQGRAYEARVLARGTTEQLCAALACGLDENAQEEMAKRLRERYLVQKSDLPTVAYIHGTAINVPSMIVHIQTPLDATKVYAASTIALVAKAIKSGVVTSPKAQAELMGLVVAEGTPKDAFEILNCGKISSPDAIELLRSASVGR
jgi:hypothetical protein